MRITDTPWSELLEQAHNRECDKRDITAIQQLILGYNEQTALNFTCPPWSNSVLVTPHHAVHLCWNEASVRQEEKLLLISRSEDIISREYQTPSLLKMIQNEQVHRNGRRDAHSIHNQSSSEHAISKWDARHSGKNLPG
jgi:hypothetical protein